MNLWSWALRRDGQRYMLLPVEKDETSPPPKSISKYWIIPALLVTNVISPFAAWYFAMHRGHYIYSQDLEGADQFYSGLDRSLHTVRFSDYTGNETSRWTAPPSEEVEKAWDELGVRDEGLYLPKSFSHIFDLDTRKHRYFPKGWFEDPDQEGFFVINQATHDLHCLNELRKALHYNHDYYRQFHNHTMVPVWFRITHINHCLDQLRERLMCTADLGMIASAWTKPGQSEIQFGMDHKCYDHMALMDWIHKRQKWEKRHYKWDQVSILPTPEDAIFSSLVATPHSH